MKNLRLALNVWLMLAALTFGCASRRTNPLKEWTLRYDQTAALLNRKAIDVDYHSYIDHLSAKEKDYIGAIELFENGNGLTAIRIDTHVTKAIRTHVLIYDSENKRIKTIKYVRGYMGH
jgi:hypothetical protein